MRGLIAGAFLLTVLIAFTLNEQKDNQAASMTMGKIPNWKISTFDAIDPSLIQDTISEIQKKEQGVYPIDTIYYNRNSDGSYQARFIFIDANSYAGVQYDAEISQDGKLTSFTKGIPANFQNPYTGNSKRSKIGTLNDVVPFPDMPKVWENYTVKV
jgi:hypothetical protein